MKPNRITRAIIDATVDRSLREIDEDPNRSIRKLTDMGRQFTKGRFLDQIYEMIQNLLRNDDSPYYAAIRNLLRNTSRTNLKEFGINVGYNSLTFGGKEIRNLEKIKPFRIPWCIVINMNVSDPRSIDAADLAHIVRQGNELGIYTYLIRCGGNMTGTAKLIETFAANPAFAFICLLPEGDLNESLLSGIKKAQNTLFMFGGRHDSTAKNIEKMNRQKSLCGIYEIYSDQTADDWLKHDRLKELLPYHCSFVFLEPDATCSCKTVTKMGHFAKSQRIDPQYPFIIFELRSDATEVGRIITDQPTDSYLELLENGDIQTKDDAVIEYRHTFSLEQLLATALPADKA